MSLVVIIFPFITSLLLLIVVIALAPNIVTDAVFVAAAPYVAKYFSSQTSFPMSDGSPA